VLALPQAFLALFQHRHQFRHQAFDALPCPTMQVAIRVLDQLLHPSASCAARRFDIGIGSDPDDLIYDIEIRSNTFENDASASSSPPYYNVGIYLSANIGTNMARSSTPNAVVHSSVSTGAVSMPSELQQPLDELRWEQSLLATIREWLIDYNRFVGVAYAVVFQYDSASGGMMRASGSLSGVSVNYNSIQLYSSCTTCAAINSLYPGLTGLNAAFNW
jgi:hypothetical protein